MSITKFQHWKFQPSLQVWHVASMLHDVDPDAMCDMVINDAGDHLDTSEMTEALLEGVRCGELKALVSAEQQSPSANTQLTKKSVLAWLRQLGYDELSDLLDNSEPVQLKKAELVSKYEPDWPQIDEDIKRQDSNGLHVARISHGVYDEKKVVSWGRRYGRLKADPKQGPTLEEVWK